MKSTLKFGLITGLISCIFLFGFFYLGVWLNAKLSWGLQDGTIQGVLGLLSIPIQAIGLYLAMQDVKKQNNSLTYGQALKTGFTVAITIGLMLASFSALHCVINPGYASMMINDAQKSMAAAGKSADQIKAASIEMTKQFNPGTQFFMALVGQFVTGAIMSLIIGLFIKTKK